MVPHDHPKHNRRVQGETGSDTGQLHVNPFAFVYLCYLLNAFARTLPAVECCAAAIPQTTSIPSQSDTHATPTAPAASLLHTLPFPRSSGTSSLLPPVHSAALFLPDPLSTTRAPVAPISSSLPRPHH